MDGKAEYVHFILSNGEFVYAGANQISEYRLEFLDELTVEEEVYAPVIAKGTIDLDLTKKAKRLRQLAAL